MPPHTQNRPEQSDLSAYLTAGLTDFKSAVTISDFLSRLLHLQAEDRISPRRAAVMAYTCNLILRSLPAIEHELHPEDEPVTISFGDLPHPPGSPRYREQAPPSHPEMSSPQSPALQVPRSPHDAHHPCSHL